MRVTRHIQMASSQILFHSNQSFSSWGGHEMTGLNYAHRHFMMIYHSSCYDLHCACMLCTPFTRSLSIVSRAVFSLGRTALLCFTPMIVSELSDTVPHARSHYTFKAKALNKICILMPRNPNKAICIPDPLAHSLVSTFTF